MKKIFIEFADTAEEFLNVRNSKGVKNDGADAMMYLIQVYKASLYNNIPETIEREKQDRINRKWQRVFIALIIANIIIYSQII